MKRIEATLFPAILFAFVWWLLLFPEILLSSELCCRYDTSEEKVELDAETLQELLFQTEAENICFESRLLDYLKNSSR